MVRSVPATLAHPSSLPNLCSVCAIQHSTSSRLRILHLYAATRSLCSGSSPTTSSSALLMPSSEELDMDTEAPRMRRYLTVARPVPRLAPLTLMTFSLNGSVLTLRMSVVYSAGPFRWSPAWPLPWSVDIVIPRGAVTGEKSKQGQVLPAKSSRGYSYLPICPWQQQ